MKCYLHIGTEKTATKTLQSFLYINKEKLAGYGFGYTKSAGLIDDRKLPVAAYDLHRRDDHTRMANINSDEDLHNYQQKIISDLKKEIKEISLPNIIFSSEHIQSRLKSAGEIQRLKDILSALGFNDISVIVYLRNPADIANSLYSTAVKSGNTTAGPRPPKHHYYNLICNHKNTLEKFEDVFGKQSLIPRIFDKNEFKNGSIIEDFIDAIGAPWSEEYIIPDNLNETLSALGIAILRRFNQKVPSFIDNKKNPLRDDIVKYFERVFKGDKYIMPKQLYHEYDIEFKESNEWVRKNWFPSRKYLFPQKEHPPESKLQIKDSDLDKIADLIASIWTEKSKRYITMKDFKNVSVTSLLKSIKRFFSGN